MPYICIDVEASGPVPPLYNLLSIGAVVVRRDRKTNLHVLGDRFYVELKPIFGGIDPGAVKVCGLDVEALRSTGTEPYTAMTQLSEWAIGQRENSKDKLVFVGHNAPFDWSYVNYYYLHFGLENPFGYNALDTKALSMGVLGVTWPDSNKETLKARLDLPEQDQEQVHRADYDAWYQALILKGLLDYPDYREKRFGKG